MAIQNIALGTAPTGAGGDTFRAAAVKLNENFTNNTHAASRLVGGSSGNVMGVGQFGIGNSGLYDLRNEDLSSPNSVLAKGLRFGIIDGSKVGGGSTFCSAILMSAWHDKTAAGAQPFILFSDDGHLKAKYAHGDVSGWAPSAVTYRSTRNTTVDSNGFIKNASPIVQLFADKIEPNEEALEQEPLFEKVDIGHYLLKNTEGFSDNGWYIEMPKDANGNVLVAVQYQQIEDNTIEVKTFAKKFDEETGDIVPNLEKPRDIPTGRWIDIRLKELPKPNIEIPISNTPSEFQPTNLAQAVAEAMKNGAEQ